MDTSKLKKFAVEARKSLMGTVGAKLKLVLDSNSFERRNNPNTIRVLEGLIKEIGEEQTIEKVAYTWFNRFIALRFMDVNHYTKIGVVSPVEGQTQPEVLSEAKAGYIDTTVVSEPVRERILGLLDGTISSPKPQEDVYRLLLVSYCNAWNKQLPFMFGRIKDYTELLLPDDLLSETSVLSQTIETLDADTCKDVEVIGWLYQYYISEKKEQLDYELKNKKGRKVQKEDMPAKTQIFTPEWIVKYMVENSVGKMWLEGHPDDDLQSKFKYYLESADQEDDVKNKLKEIINQNLKPQDIKVLDPASGSAHILVKAFEVLFEIYKSQGWQENEIPEMILKHNLYGLDICDRAAQLSQLAVMMKARKYDRNIFNKITELNICSIKDTNWIDSTIENELLIGVSDKDKATKQIRLLQETFKDAKEYGSMLKVEGLDFDFWDERINYFNQKGQASFYGDIIRGRLKFIIKQAKLMQQKYEVTITNPPYLGNTYFDEKLVQFMKDEYPLSKSDTCVAFIERLLDMTQDNGYFVLVTMQSWMFLSSFEGFRKKILTNATMTSMTHMGNGVMRIAFGTCATIWKKIQLDKLKAIYSWVENKDITEEDVPYKFPIKDNGKYNIVAQNGFSSIPGSPIAYWASDRVREIFRTSTSLTTIAQPKQGLATADNDRFLRRWNEVSLDKIGLGYASSEEAKESRRKWFPYNKGGEFRKWYGNNEYLVNWYNDGYEIKHFTNKDGKLLSRPQNTPYYFRESITWSFISSSCFGVRYSLPGAVFDVAGSSAFSETNRIKYLTGFLCSKIVYNFLGLLNPTMNFQVGNVASLPIIFNENKKQQIDTLVEQNIAISKDDWDSFETSWDFEEHPLIRFKVNEKVADSFNAWAKYKEQQFNQLKANEEELNRLFIEIYGLQDEMTPDVTDKDITVAKADELRDIKSLISYAVGCMFGRYSLDTKGLIYAGGDFDESKYKTFKADKDNAIPVLSDNYFVDDIVERFHDFIKVAFGEKHFEENLLYIANVLGRKNSQSADQVLRDYFIKDFYKDHVQMYQKRPIYWMFSSEKNGFNALVYLHRYNKDTVNIVLNDYLREYQNKLSAKISSYSFMESKDDNSVSDKIKAGKERQSLQIMLNEAEEYERNILHPLATERKEIDLDDGVKVNYLEFGKALRNI